MRSVFNPSASKRRRQDLRNNRSEPERKVWALLRNQQMGVKFRRQHGIGPYIADFYCPALKLVVEIDGDSHGSMAGHIHDQAREAFMHALGIKTIRLSNDDVMRNIEGVYQCLQQQMNLQPSKLD